MATNESTTSTAASRDSPATPARTALGSDKDNIVAAFEGASTKQDWILAARLLAGAFAVFYAHPTEGVRGADQQAEQPVAVDLV